MDSMLQMACIKSLLCRCESVEVSGATLSQQVGARASCLLRPCCSCTASSYIVNLCHIFVWLFMAVFMTVLMTVLLFWKGAENYGTVSTISAHWLYFLDHLCVIEKLYSISPVRRMPGLQGVLVEHNNCICNVLCCVTRYAVFTCGPMH